MNEFKLNPKNLRTILFIAFLAVLYWIIFPLQERNEIIMATLLLRFFTSFSIS